MRNSLIIPCYFANQELIDITQQCIDSLRDPIDQLIVVDDGSPLRSKLSTMRRHRNGGYAKAVNSGLRKANGDVLIISNNDIVFYPGWLQAILQPLRQGYDISSIRTSDSDGWEIEDKITEGDKFGSIWAMKRKVYETLGGLDETFGKGYAEDLDYRRRAINAGFRIAKNHAGLVEHQGKATFRQVDPEDRHYHQALKHYKEKWGFLE